MKLIGTLPLILALSASGLALAQTGAMKDMDNKQCMDMKDMKGMDSKQCMDMIKKMDQKTQGKAAKKATHEAVAVVKKVDATSGKVTLAHEPIKSLSWPAMTMAFAVKDKALIGKLTVGNKVHVEFNKQDSDYVITKVK